MCNGNTCNSIRLFVLALPILLSGCGGGESGGDLISTEADRPESILNTLTDQPGNADTPPDVTLIATPESVNYNGEVRLAWSASNAESCTASGDWSGAKATSGALTLGGIVADSLFKLECHGSGGRTATETTVKVLDTPVQVSISANPEVVPFNGSTELSWSSSGAAVCNATGSWSGEKEIDGKQEVTDLTSDITFTLSCEGPAGSDYDTATVHVQTPAVGYATLSWMPPSTNTDGSALTDLAGYRIYYGEASGQLTTRIDVNEPGIASYRIDNLAPAKYYFAIAAINGQDVESDLSNEVFKLIN